ncbi:hypothetical protein Agub_g2078, partial [Astrephomene gubernaculifera]
WKQFVTALAALSIKTLRSSKLLKMMLCNQRIRITSGRQGLSTRQTNAPARSVSVAAKKEANNGGSRSLDERGYISQDNSGRSNIFPTSSKAYYSSPTSNAVASSGLGGGLGAAVLAAAVAIVTLVTVAVVSRQPSETLEQVNDVYAGDSLTVIAERLSNSL